MLIIDRIPIVLNIHTGVCYGHMIVLFTVLHRRPGDDVATPARVQRQRQRQRLGTLDATSRRCHMWSHAPLQDTH